MMCTPSSQVVKVLADAVQRASRLGFAVVGTENLLIVLADAIGPGRRLGVWSVRAHAVARGVGNWAADDGGAGEADPDVAALMRTAHDRTGLESALPVSRALDECLRAAIAEAGDGVLTTTHLSVALLSLKSGRAAELLAVLRVDAEATIEAVRRAAKPEEAPAVRLLRKAGALEGDAGGGYVRWLVRFVARGQGLGGPVLTVVRNEAHRLALAAGREEATAADLVAAVLTVDDQLTAAGRRLRPEFESGGAAALRAAGVDPAALPAASGAGVGRFVEGAKAVAARRGDAVVSTEHLLVAVRDDLLDPVGRVLRGLAVET
ncbi:hypothetical protein UK23_27625 [Lentzea aerocolonigenes]|uniref:Clp R domain-containing protein n=1 Tax=Lentzea aerocolonigenes TaxID=68170 RepID=A0A0F0GSJ9_LENAE|nr:Clp protease N-terminal domain-containing protein [Lentzea aerocolonigenes]KJK44962.1 hypothetical protein UK23_27625 [Lentzea aerocolonigenes]